MQNGHESVSICIAGFWYLPELACSKGLPLGGINLSAREPNRSSLDVHRGVVRGASGAFVDLQLSGLVDACVSRMHQPFRVEFPVLIAIGPKPIARVIVILVGKPDGNPVVQKCPEFLDKPVVQLSDPLPREQRDDLLTPVGELGSISPARIYCVRKGDFLRVSAVPAVFCQPNLLGGGFPSKGRQWGTRGHENILSVHCSIGFKGRRRSQSKVDGLQPLLACLAGTQ